MVLLRSRGGWPAGILHHARLPRMPHPSPPVVAVVGPDRRGQERPVARPRASGSAARSSTPTRCRSTAAWTSAPPSCRPTSGAGSRTTCSTCSTSPSRRPWREFQALARAVDRRLPGRGRGPGAGRRLGALHPRGARPVRVPGHRPRVRAPARGRAGRGRVRRRCTSGCRRSTRRPRAKVLPSNGRRVVRALEVIETHRPAVQRVAAGAAVLLRRARAGRRPHPAAGARRADRAAGPPDVGRRPRRRGAPARARGLREGRTASRALGYQQVLAFLDGRVHRAAGVRGDRRAHPAVRPAPGRVVPQGPADHLGGLGRPGPGRACG